MYAFQITCVIKLSIHSSRLCPQIFRNRPNKYKLNMPGSFNFSIGKEPIRLPMDKENVALALCNPISCRLNSRFYVCKYNCYELQSRAKSQ